MGKGHTMAELEPFSVRGTEQNPKTVKAEDVLEAIAEGRDVDIEHAVIDGELDIGQIEDRLERGKDGRLTIRGGIRICRSRFSGSAAFNVATFSERADFREATFSGSAGFREATFSGEADFIGATFSRRGATFSERADFIEATFSGEADFSGATFSGRADFREATFSGRAAFFNVATFSGRADFRDATFSGEADFIEATFSREADFSGATFSEEANFKDVTMERPASFAAVHFLENTVSAGLWNHILRPAVRFISRTEAWLLNRVADFIPIIPVGWLRSIPAVKLPKMPVTDFLNFNTTTVMDGSSNPYLKRYIDDEQWIASWRERGGRWKRFLFILWELTSHCGRSIKLWAGWSAFIAMYFACMYYCKFGCDRIAFNVDRLKEVQPDFLDYLYYSVVTFTTLGFGDIVPLDKGARLVVGAEVILGYIMLGGLISIFANKLARRA